MLLCWRPDVNECASTGTCETNAACANTDGSFECTCNDGYNGDGQTCTGAPYFYWPFVVAIIFDLSVALATSPSSAEVEEACHSAVYGLQ